MGFSMVLSSMTNRFGPSMMHEHEQKPNSQHTQIRYWRQLSTRNVMGSKFDKSSIYHPRSTGRRVVLWYRKSRQIKKTMSEVSHTRSHADRRSMDSRSFFNTFSRRHRKERSTWTNSSTSWRQSMRLSSWETYSRRENYRRPGRGIYTPGRDNIPILWLWQRVELLAMRIWTFSSSRRIAKKMLFDIILPK